MAAGKAEEDKRSCWQEAGVAGPSVRVHQSITTELRHHEMIRGKAGTVHTRSVPARHGSQRRLETAGNHMGKRSTCMPAKSCQVMQ